MMGGRCSRNNSTGVFFTLVATIFISGFVYTVIGVLLGKHISLGLQAITE